MATKKTHMVVKAGTSNTGDVNQQLQLRAARFGLDKGASPASSNSKPKTVSSAPMDPVEAEKLAKRAARFADVHKVNSGTLPAAGTTAVGGKISTRQTPVVATSSDPAEAERLAKRAARFADIPK